MGRLGKENRASWGCLLMAGQKCWIVAGQTGAGWFSKGKMQQAGRWPAVHAGRNYGVSFCLENTVCCQAGCMTALHCIHVNV